MTSFCTGSTGKIRPFPREYLRFVELFNAGKYWESHEVLEGPWRVSKSPFFKGMIIYASAFVHAQRGNPRGVVKQMRKAERYLAEYRPHYMGMDVDRILSHAARCMAIAAQLAPPAGQEFARAFPFDRLTLDPGLVRGDEPEMDGETVKRPEGPATRRSSP